MHKIKVNKKLVGGVCALLLCVSLSLVFSLTRCSKGDDVPKDDTKYNTLGTNWEGYLEGKLTMKLDNENRTAYIQNNNSYKANNLVIPKTVFENDRGYIIIPDNFMLTSNYITGTIKIPSTFEYIGGNYNISINCPEADSVIIPKSVTTLRDQCINVKYLQIPDSVTTIGDAAFSNCNALISIEIPDSVKSIGQSAFLSCRSLTSITIPSSVTFIEDSTFDECTSLTSFIIPSNVTSIGSGAFMSCSNLTSIDIPNNVTSIGDFIFRDCRSLSSVTISDNLTSLGNYAFYNCSGLASINIPNNVTSIGYYTFYGCSNSLVNNERRNLYLPSTSSISAISNWTDDSDITLGIFTFDKNYWNIQKR